MYTYKRAVGISRLNPKGEELLDISAVQTKDLFTQFENLVIVIRDELTFTDVALEALRYQQSLMAFTGVIQDWLTANAAVPLITSNKLPGDRYRYVTMADITYKWFTLFPGDTSLGDEQNELLTVSQAKDIRVKKTDNTAVDYDALVHRSLWTYNGHLVRAVKGNNCLYLINAGKHFNVDDNCFVTNLNFNTVSTLNTYPFSKEQINFEAHDTYNFLHLKAPVSLVGKTVWLVLGGRLYMTDSTQVTGEQSIVINTEQVDWFSRTFDSKDKIDLSRVIEKDREVVSKDFFTSKEFFETLLTDPSSFLIVFDNPHLYVEAKPLVTYQYPFTFHTEETRPLPLLTGGGLLPKYNTRKIINRRLLDINFGQQKKYLNDTTGPHNNGGDLYHGYTNRFQPSTFHQGYFLYIRGLIQED